MRKPRVQIITKPLMIISQWVTRAKRKPLSGGQVASSLLLGLWRHHHATRTLRFVEPPQTARDHIAATTSVWMWRRTDSTAGSVGWNATRQRYAATVMLCTQCQTRNTAGPATTIAREVVRVRLECAAMLRRSSLDFYSINKGHNCNIYIAAMISSM